jgi:hypothetical protein
MSKQPFVLMPKNSPRLLKSHQRARRLPTHVGIVEP